MILNYYHSPLEPHCILSKWRVQHLNLLRILQLCITVIYAQFKIVMNLLRVLPCCTIKLILSFMTACLKSLVGTIPVKLPMCKEPLFS